MSGYITFEQSAAYYEARGENFGEQCDDTCHHDGRLPQADHERERSQVGYIGRELTDAEMVKLAIAVLADCDDPFCAEHGVVIEGGVPF